MMAPATARLALSFNFTSGVAPRGTTMVSPRVVTTLGRPSRQSNERPTVRGAPRSTANRTGVLSGTCVTSDGCHRNVVRPHALTTRHIEGRAKRTRRRIAAGELNNGRNVRERTPALNTQRYVVAAGTKRVVGVKVDFSSYTTIRGSAEFRCIRRSYTEPVTRATSFGWISGRSGPRNVAMSAMCA